MKCPNSHQEAYCLVCGYESEVSAPQEEPVAKPPVVKPPVVAASETKKRNK